MARWVKAKQHFGSRRCLDAKPLGADGDTSVGADLEEGAQAPDIVPPGAVRCGTQCGAFFLLGLIPGPLGCLAQFSMDFPCIVVLAQVIDVLVGGFDFGDLFAGEVGRQASLPELVFAFDLAFGLGRGRVAQADVIELERPAQLGKRVRVLGEENAVVIDIELQGAAVGQKGGGQEVEVGEQQFTLVKFGAGKEAAAVIEHVKHGESGFAAGKPAVRRGVQLPELADLGALPAAHRGQNPLGGDDMGQVVFNGPAPDLGTVEFEGMQPQSFGGGEAVRARGNTLQPFFEKLDDRLGPSGGMVATRGVGCPQTLLAAGASLEVIGVKGVEAAGRQAELLRSLDSRQGAPSESLQYMADEGGSVTMDELLVLFKDRRIPADAGCAIRLFVGPRYARPPQRRMAQPGTFLFC